MDFEDVDIRRIDFSPQEILDLIEKEKKKSFNPIYLLFISALLFVVIGSRAYDKHYLILIVPVIFIHELGHLMAMKFYGYKDTKILFIPLLGGLASGIPQQYNRAKESLVFLAGPLVGIVGAFIFLIVYRLTKSQIWFELSFYSFIIDGLNLLPIPPLDGGRLIESLITSRNIFLDITYKILGATALIMIAFHLKSWVLGAFGYFAALLIWNSFLENSTIRSVNKHGLAGDELNVENVSIIMTTIKFSYRGVKPWNPKKYMAIRVKDLFDKLHYKNAPWLSVVGISISYLILLFVALAFTAGAMHIKKHLGHSGIQTSAVKIQH